MDLQQQDVNGLGEYFINSGVQNFGIKGRTDRQAKIFPANTLTIDFFGNAYYRPFPYKLATHNHVFSLSGEILRNELVGLYIVAQLSYLSKLYSFNNMGTWPRIREQIIQLPVTKKGNIDFVFIEERVRELEEERVRELEAYLSEAGFDDCTLTDEEIITIKSLNRATIKEVRIGDLFVIHKGKRLTKANMIPGNTRFIGATSDNNGITNKIANDTHVHSSNKITVTYNGSVGEAFYQTEPFWASDDVNVLYPKSSINENCALYFLAPLRKKGKGYAYSFKWTKEKMENDRIMVPCKIVRGKYVCDYDFMESYISAIKKQCVARLKQEIEREHRAYEHVLEKEPINDNVIEIPKQSNQNIEGNVDYLRAAEPFECYKWEGFDQSICDFFGGDKTILLGCYKGKKYQDWINAHNIYNIRLGKTKGSMEEYRDMFDRTSLLVLYELDKPERMTPFKVVGHQQMGREELKAMDYPSRYIRKSYMTFNITLLEMDLSFLIEQRLIEKLMKVNSNIAKGTPVFIEP